MSRKRDPAEVGDAEPLGGVEACREGGLRHGGDQNHKPRKTGSIVYVYV